MMSILIIAIQKLLIMLGLWAGVINIKNVSHLKKIDKELLPVVWHCKRWRDWCMPENEIKKILGVCMKQYKSSQLSNI